MLDQGSVTPADGVDAMIKQSWRLEDQENAFTTCVYTPSTNTVFSICGPWIATQGYTANQLTDGIKVQGSEITALLLNQTLEYFQKGLHNFFAQYLLAHKGLITWAGVTNYYASFFSVQALLCLQGRNITQISIGADKKMCHVLPLNFPAHEFVFCRKALRPRTGSGSHRLVWERYYDIYDRYTHPYTEFDKVSKEVYTPDPYDESDQRNLINYELFAGFSEIIIHDEMEEFKKNYLDALSVPPVGNPLKDYLIRLDYLTTDPDFMYFARVALRLLSIALILQRIAQNNNDFREEWLRRIPLWRQFALITFSDPPRNFFESIPQLLQ